MKGMKMWYIITFVYEFTEDFVPDLYILRYTHTFEYIIFHWVSPEHETKGKESAMFQAAWEKWKFCLFC